MQELQTAMFRSFDQQFYQIGLYFAYKYIWYNVGIYGSSLAFSGLHKTIHCCQKTETLRVRRKLHYVDDKYTTNLQLVIDLLYNKLYNKSTTIHNESNKRSLGFTQYNSPNHGQSE